MRAPPCKCLQKYTNELYHESPINSTDPDEFHPILSKNRPVFSGLSAFCAVSGPFAGIGQKQAEKYQVDIDFLPITWYMIIDKTLPVK
jgi:hypothetical protein